MKNCHICRSIGVCELNGLGACDGHIEDVMALAFRPVHRLRDLIAGIAPPDLADTDRAGPT